MMIGRGLSGEGEERLRPLDDDEKNRHTKNMTSSNYLQLCDYSGNLTIHFEIS